MKKQSIQRKARGSMMAEMVVTLPIFVTMSSLCLNAIFGVLAYFILDETCVDAARAAAMSRGAGEASLRANAIAKSHARTGIEPVVTLKKFDTKNGDILAGPYLVLETRVKYKMPFPLIIFNQTILPQKMELARVYSYPILPVVIPNPDDGPGGDSFDDNVAD